MQRDQGIQTDHGVFYNPCPETTPRASTVVHLGSLKAKTLLSQRRRICVCFLSTSVLRLFSGVIAGFAR